MDVLLSHTSMPVGIFSNSILCANYSFVITNINVIVKRTSQLLTPSLRTPVRDITRQIPNEQRNIEKEYKQIEFLVTR